MNSDIAFALNGNRVAITVEPRELLGHVLRERLGCRGAHLACGQGICGACTVLLDGQAVRSCLLLAVQAHGHQIQTISALAPGEGPLHPLQVALKEAGAIQCGYCTAGIVLSTLSYLRETSAPSREDMRQALAGHICRCTGYTAILDAVMQYAQRHAHTSEQVDP
ncbi:(2Fe-2S)-binding protein [Streptomyces collinus]|uniref:(2Fe-2S)-binding protein n=1 Tax=Streptomyces collinus TaxID=42684 RepID=UPI0036B230AB